MIKVEDFVFETFLRLTSKTVPYGSEDILVESMRDLFPKNMEKDKWGNYFYKIGESRSIFAAHLDTVSKEYVDVNHVFDGELIKTDGKTTLGADDKAGITILLWMIQNNVPGTYYFFIGEEVGCIGSGNAAKYGHFKGIYDRIISFDRRDVFSVITHQSWSRCCSDSFAESLVKEFNKNSLSYRKDDGGVYTDSAEFTELIPECTNISVGYYKEHTTNESQNIVHLTNLARACVNVDWENLPTKRDINKKDYKDSCYGTYGSHRSGSWNSWGSKGGGIDYGYGNNRGRKNKSKKGGSRNGYHDDWYDDDFDKYDDFDSIDDLSDNTSKKYIDQGGKLIDITNYIDNDNITIKKVLDSDTKYDWILARYTESEIEYWELQIIKEQYLDMNSEYDKYFYEYLLERMYDQHS